MFNITCLDQDGTPIQNFTQWDMGQSILIDGLTLDKPPQVHYWNAQSEQAYVDDKVALVDGKYKSTVPNALLMSAIAIYVAIYPFDSATTSGKTIAQVRLSVNPRPEPADYVFENNIDIVYIKDLVEEINGVKNTVDTDLIPKMNAFRTEVSKATTDVKNVSTAEQGKITTKSTEEQNKIATLATTHKQEMQKIKDSIPVDYNALSTNMTTVLDTFADGIKNSVSGAMITLGDSSNKKCEVEILGKTVQDGEPTPDNPVPIKGVGESGKIVVSCVGRNVLNLKSAKTTSDLTIVKATDEELTIKGSAGSNKSVVLDPVWLLKDTVLTIKNEINIDNGNEYATDKTGLIQLKNVEQGLYANITPSSSVQSYRIKETALYTPCLFLSGTALTTGEVRITFKKPFVGFPTDAVGEIFNGNKYVDIPLTAPLYGLDKQDRICKKDGVWGIERNVKTKNTWLASEIRHNTAWSDTVNYNMFHLMDVNYKSTSALSNIFKMETSITKEGLLLDTVGTIYFMIDKKRNIITSEQMAKFLTDNKCEIFYSPKNENLLTFEPFTEDIQQKLNALTTYYGTTVLYTTDELQPTINVDYIADTKLYINKQIKNAVTELQSQLASALSLMPTNVQAEMIENDTNNLLQSI